MKFYSKYNNFHWRKCIWKVRLQNVDYLASALLCFLGAVLNLPQHLWWKQQYFLKILIVCNRALERVARERDKISPILWATYVYIFSYFNKKINSENTCSLNLSNMRRHFGSPPHTTTISLCLFSNVNQDLWHHMPQRVNKNGITVFRTLLEWFSDKIWNANVPLPFGNGKPANGQRHTYGVVVFAQA